MEPIFFTSFQTRVCPDWPFQSEVKKTSFQRSPAEHICTKAKTKTLPIISRFNGRFGKTLPSPIRSPRAYPPALLLLLLAKWLKFAGKAKQKFFFSFPFVLPLSAQEESIMKLFSCACSVKKIVSCSL